MKIEREKINSLLQHKDFEKVIFDIEGKAFEVGIIREVKERHIKKGLEKLLLNTDLVMVSNESATVFGAILVLEILTDIEFPEDTADKLDMFLDLDELGILPELYEAIGEEKIQSFSEQLKKLSEQATELFEGVNSDEPKSNEENS
jgi:hypothetical protein